jgi:hypothetical protein
MSSARLSTFSDSFFWRFALSFFFLSELRLEELSI